MNFRKDINGLRAIAVLAVILFHFRVTGFNGGFSGVDIFFVISGYLMTGIIFTKVRNNNFSIIDFYLHRARRIIPALAALCITLSIFGFFYLLTEDLREVTQNIRKAMLFVSNYAFYNQADYFDTAAQENWLLHTWSLSVEWQFYLIYPLLIMGLYKLFNQRTTILLLIIAAITSLVFSIAYTPINPSFAFYSLPTRAWEMFAGGVVFLFPLTLSPLLKKLTEWLGLGLLVLGLVLLKDSFLWPGYLALIPVIGTMLIIWSNQNSIITSNSPFQWIGKISYSVYLWHWPIVVFLLITGLLLNPLYKIFGIVVACILGTLSYFCIEKQFKLSGHKTIDLVKYSGIILITIAIAASVGSLVKHYPQSRETFLFSKAFQKLNRTIVHKFDSFTKKCLLANNLPPSSACVIGNGPTNIIALGDSHASVLFTSIVKLNTKGSSVFWAMAGCPFVENIKFNKKMYQRCSEFVPSRLKLLETNYLNVPVLISNHLTEYFHDLRDEMYFEDSTKTFEENFHSSYIDTICRIAKNHPVYILKPIPEYPYNIPKKMASNSFYSIDANPTSITTSLSNYQSENKYILKTMEEASKKCGATLLDPTTYLCENNICYANDGDVPLYFDSHHLTEEGAIKLAPLIKQVFNITK